MRDLAGGRFGYCDGAQHDRWVVEAMATLPESKSSCHAARSRSIHEIHEFRACGIDEGFSSLKTR